MSYAPFPLLHFADQATYIDPHRYSAAIDHVLVNGRFVMRNAALTGEKPGRWIKGPASNR